MRVLAVGLLLGFGLGMAFTLGRVEPPAAQDQEDPSLVEEIARLDTIIDRTDLADLNASAEREDVWRWRDAEPGLDASRMEWDGWLDAAPDVTISGLIWEPCQH